MQKQTELFGRSLASLFKRILRLVGKENLVLLVGLLPVTYVGLLILGTGSYKMHGYQIEESDGARFFQALLLSFGVAVLLWHFRRRSMELPIDSTREAIKFLGAAREAYHAKGLEREAKLCDSMIARIAEIALDPRIELNLK